jgi:hypothetical protein
MSRLTSNLISPPRSESEWPTIVLVTAGRGEVYVAEDSKLDRKVALKFLPEKPAIEGECMRRFVLEAKAVSAATGFRGNPGLKLATAFSVLNAC